ncbi:MAG: mannose-1-phosphate guanylyltransferase [Cycloclasticus sp.]|nr:MAG: mannose-1-phosphate guanylyltransferase [Cycloclasticus sp.]
MKVMILAAGRGVRMGALTENCPKPLLKLAGKSLIEHHLLALKEQGFNEFVINVAYLGAQIKNQLGDGEKWGIHIDYSNEGDQALETGGGIFHALPLLGSEPFLVVNGDVWTDFPYASLRSQMTRKIHLVLVKNPSHNVAGDFSLVGGRIVPDLAERYTYSGVGVFNPAIFELKRAGIFPLAPIIREEIARCQVTGQLHLGEWVDVGTPERMTELERKLLLSQ